MVQQEYVVRTPKGATYQFNVKIPDEPVVGSRGDKSVILNADWVKVVLEGVIARNADYGQIVPYFSGHLKCLRTLGIISDISHEEIPRPPPDEGEVPKSNAPKPDEPQPLWAAWQRI